MVAWTNLHPVTVGEIKVGSRTVLFNDARFEVKSHKKGKTILRCYQANPAKGYGEGVLVELDSTTNVLYDSNQQKRVLTK